MLITVPPPQEQILDTPLKRELPIAPLFVVNIRPFFEQFIFYTFCQILLCRHKELRFVYEFSLGVKLLHLEKGTKRMNLAFLEQTDLLFVQHVFSDLL